MSNRFTAIMIQTSGRPVKFTIIHSKDFIMATFDVHYVYRQIIVTSSQFGFKHKQKIQLCVCSFVWVCQTYVCNVNVVCGMLFY